MVRTSRTLAVLVALVMVCLPASGQNFGEIRGTVTDPPSEAIVGASVTVTNGATGVAHSVTTNSVDNFNVPFLNPGTYIATQREASDWPRRLLLHVADVAQAKCRHGG